MSHSIVKRLTSIGIALSAEKDIDTLLNMILDEAKEMTKADAGTLYVVDNENQTLVFSIMHNDTNNIHARHKRDIDMVPVPLYLSDGTPNHANVSSHAALTGRNINIEDVYETEKFDFSGPKKYDRITGYRSRSMLVIPMQDHHGDILGVVQLINATDPGTGEVCKFTEKQAEMVASLASQAAVSLNNARLIQNLEDLLQAFIKTIASAIDAKSKYTGNHIRRVVQLTMDIVEAINQCDRPPFDTIHFDDNQIQELSLASWLHDVGKIITPQHIIDKHAKLETVIDRAELIRTRFQVIESSLRLENAQAKIDGLIRNETGQAIQHLDTQLDAAIKELHAELELILSCNRSLEFMPPTRLEQIRAIGRKTYIWQGRKYPYLSENEMDNLCIQKGNLSEKERKIVEDHARATWDMLSQLPFPKHLANVATYAAQHHEKLNGSGYSQGLTEKDLPLQSRILAIADIFEALTAADRPYKDPMPISRALEIMGLMKKDGQLDPDVLDLFINNKVFMKYVTNEVDPSLNDIT